LRLAVQGFIAFAVLSFTGLQGIDLQSSTPGMVYFPVYVRLLDNRQAAEGLNAALLGIKASVDGPFWNEQLFDILLLDHLRLVKVGIQSTCIFFSFPIIAPPFQ